MKSGRDDELEFLVQVARRAARLIAAIYETPFEVEYKGPDNPVTVADRRANALICEALAERFPGDAVLAEESVPADRAEITRRMASERVFFVDPLDGTREFAARNGEFAVMIGLTRRGRAELGVVVEPTTNVAFAGRVGAPGFVEAADGSRRPLRLSDERRPADLRLLLSRSHPSPRVEDLQRTLGVGSVVHCGSVGVKIARLATARAELYVHGGAGGSLWDSCAPEAILLSAGGVFTDLGGAHIDYRDSDLSLRRGIVASARADVHASVVSITRGWVG